MLFGFLSRGKTNKIIIFSFFLILPLIYLRNIFSPYEFPKFIFFSAIVFMLFLLNIKAISKKMISFKFDFLTKLALVYVSVVYFADLLGIDPRTSFLGSEFRHQGFITLLSGVILFLLLRYIFNKYNSIFVNSILLSSFFVCIFALWQGIGVYIFHDFSIPTYQGRIVGAIGNPNSLAGYLAIVFPFAFYVKNKIIRVILSVMIMLVIFLAESRAGILAVGIILAIWMILFIKRLVLRKKIIVIIAGIVFLIFLVQLFQGQRAQFNRSSIWDNRGLIWSEGLKAVFKQPILGYGQENFELIFPQERHMKVDNAHNIFLETAISSGLLGLIIFAGIIITAFKRANLTVKLSLLSFLVVAQFNPLSIPQIVLFWFLLAIA